VVSGLEYLPAETISEQIKFSNILGGLQDVQSDELGPVQVKQFSWQFKQELFVRSTNCF
jgi:hypothetical protein